MKKVAYLLLFFLCAFQGKAQYNIELTAPELGIDTMFLGYFYGKNQFILDTALVQDGKYTFVDSAEVHDGLYFFYSQEAGFFKQIILDKQRTFHVKIGKDSSLIFEHSPQNTAFNAYIAFLNKERGAIANLKRGGIDSAQLVKYREDINKAVEDYQNNVLEEYRDSLLSVLINLNRSVDIPEFAKAGEKRQKLQYQYFIKHYFDNLNFKDDRLIYTPGFIKKVDAYLDDYIVQDPDTLIVAIDNLLEKTGYHNENFKYLLIDVLNKYAVSKIIGMDEIYVHLVNKYYSQGYAPWVSNKQIAKMVRDASQVENILIGKQAPPLRMNNQAGEQKALYEIPSKFTVLVFWTPECGHCREAIPELAQKYKQYKKKGVKIYAVCTEVGEEADTCWSFINEHPLMQDFINVTDPMMKSRFKSKYKVWATPKFFLLDENKKIIMKKFAIGQFDDVVQHFISEAKEESTSRPDKASSGSGQ